QALGPGLRQPRRVRKDRAGSVGSVEKLSTRSDQAHIIAGTTLTWGAAWVGVTIATSPVCRHSRVSTARLRVKAVSDATAQYMMDNASSCPRGIDELVSQKYLDPSNAKDPWGNHLIFHCPGSCDNSCADISSVGPDGQHGTSDDINSWEL